MNIASAAQGARCDLLCASFSTSYAGVVAFIAVASEGSFARAGDRLGVGRSAVSRSVQKLERQLGTRLFVRTTRATSLTREGEQFYESCRPGVERILQALDEMRDLRDGPPRGQLRVSASHGFGRKVIAPLLSGFLDLHPGIAVELLLTDANLDLVGNRIDVAFRDGALEDSEVIARQVIPMRMIVCAAPDYLARKDTPTVMEELAMHACIGQRLPNGRLQSWEFRVGGKPIRVVPHSDLVFNDPELVEQAALEGRGLAQLPAYQVRDALREGALRECLGAFAPDDRGHYLCYLSRSQQQPKRIRAFIDYITAQIRALDVDGIGAWDGSMQVDGGQVLRAAA